MSLILIIEKRIILNINMILDYVAKLDLGCCLDFNDVVEFKFILISFTNFLKGNFIEFKYSDNNRILEK